MEEEKRNADSESAVLNLPPQSDFEDDLDDAMGISVILFHERI
jgi:hypothetical protein